MFAVNKVGEEKQIEFIVDEANKIWKKVQDSNVDVTDFKACDELFKTLRIEHADFSKTLPLVLRVMVQARQYNSKALERYLKKLRVSMKQWKSMDDYIESQADYMVFLYKATHKHYSPRDVQAVKEHQMKVLKKENEDMKKYSEEMEKELTEQNKKISEERRKLLYEALMQQKDSSS